MKKEVEKITMGGMEFPARVKMNWEEQFLMMKRWYYRLRGDEDIFGLKTIYREDFFIAFFITCNHFREWLVKNKIITNGELKKYVAQYDELELCREIADFSKHVKLWPNHKDQKTEVIGKKIVTVPSEGSTYFESVLKIKSPGRNIETYNTFELVEECMNIWGNFLLSKSLKIPDMPEEHMFQNFVKWEPKPLTPH